MRAIWARMISGLMAATAAMAAGPTRAQSLADVRMPDTPLTLVQQGSFFVGGKAAPSAATGWDQLGLKGLAFEGGSLMHGQTYVQFQKPAGWQRHLPVVFVHGCCLTSKTWETTPDGRMGWYEYFTRRGRATYLAEQAGRARSGFDATVVNEVRQGQKPPSALGPVLLASRETIWNIFRFGPRVGEAWPDEKFPMAHVDDLQRQIVPDFITYEYPGMYPAFEHPDVDNPTVEGMSVLAQELGGVVLVGHSQSAAYPTQAALKGRPGIRGIVQLETGCVAGLSPAQARSLARIPMLVLVGDHFPDPQPPAKCVEEMKLVNGAGGDMRFVALPQLGLHGNSHMMMQDTNNIAVADVILDWIDAHVEHRGAKGATAR